MESRRENCLEINPWSKKRVGKDGFRKEDDEKMSRLTNRVSRLKTMNPMKVCGIYKFAIESTHGGRLMKFRNSAKMQINSRKIRILGEGILLNDKFLE